MGQTLLLPKLIENVKGIKKNYEKNINIYHTDVKLSFSAGTRILRAHKDM